MSLDRYQGWAWLCCEYGDGTCDAETESMPTADRSDVVPIARRQGWTVREDAGVDLCPKHAKGAT